jgi:decaprenylphospho-beta-D-erythro-pentofuranosid-2-ulose 2-reductase
LLENSPPKDIPLHLPQETIEKLKALEADLKVRYDANVSTTQFDALDFEGHESFYRTLPEKPDVVIVCLDY